MTRKRDAEMIVTARISALRDFGGKPPMTVARFPRLAPTFAPSLPRRSTGPTCIPRLYIRGPGA
jgi:hypothetical protein